MTTAAAAAAASTATAPDGPVVYAGASLEEADQTETAIGELRSFACLAGQCHGRSIHYVPSFPPAWAL